MSQDQEINRLVNACREILAIAPHIDDAINRMRDDHRGQPRSPSTEPGRAHHANSPVETALTQRCEGERNLATIRTITRHTPDLERFARLITNELPHTADTAARLATTPNPGMLCEWKDCHAPSRNMNATDVGGRLKTPIVLCSKHYAWVGRTRDPMRRVSSHKTAGT